MRECGVRVSKDLRVAVVGSTDYLKSHDVPREPRDLNNHPCIGIRLGAGPYRWEFKKGRKAVTINVQGPVIFDDTNLVIQAPVNGVGLGLALEEQVAELIMKRRLIRVLEDWCPHFPAFFLC